MVARVLPLRSRRALRVQTVARLFLGLVFVAALLVLIVAVVASGVLP